MSLSLSLSLLVRQVFAKCLLASKTGALSKGSYEIKVKSGSRIKLKRTPRNREESGREPEAERVKGTKPRAEKRGSFIG